MFAVRRSWHGFLRHRGVDAAAALTFFTTLAIFPIVLSVVSFLALLDGGRGSVTRLMKAVDDVAPHSTAAVLAQPIAAFTHLANPAFGLTIGLGLSLWSISGYATAFGRAVNSVYEVQEGRVFWRFRWLMLLLSVPLLIAGATAIAILLLTPDVVGALHLGAPWTVVWSVGRWALLVAVLLIIVALLYYFTPNIARPRLRWVSWGSAFAIVVWALATAGFAVYIANFSSYGKLYGWLGGAIILLLWFYLTNLVLVFGAELDAELVRVRQLHAGIAAEEVVQLPLRDSTRNLVLARQLARDVAEGRSLRERGD